MVYNLVGGLGLPIPALKNYICTLLSWFVIKNVGGTSNTFSGFNYYIVLKCCNLLS